LANSEEKESETDYMEIIMQSAKDLESIAVDLYNNHDFSSAERLCTIIQQMYEKLESSDDIKRMKEIVQKILLVDQYFDATFGLMKRQLDAKNEEPEKEEKD